MASNAAESLAADIAAAYAALCDYVDAKLAAVLVLGPERKKRKALRELQLEITARAEELAIATEEWATNELKLVHRLGAQQTLEQTGGSFVWNEAHRSALLETAEDVSSRLLSATEHMSADAKAIIRKAAAGQTVESILTGSTATQAGRKLAKEIAGHPISAIVYRNGARHDLRSYSAMVLLTNTAIAYNTGALVEAEQQGAKYVRVLDGPRCSWLTHTTGGHANGKIVPLTEAAAHTIAHPSCRRTFAAMPELTTDAEARKAEELGRLVDEALVPTDEQNRSVLAFDAERTAVSRRVAVRNARLAARTQRLQARVSAGT